MDALDVLVGLAVVAGLVGILVPLMPGSALIAAAVLVWAAVEGTSGAWVTFTVVAVLLAAGSVVKYLVPGKRMKDSGVPTKTLLIGAVVGIAGFFVVPVIGLPLGFVGGIYLAEWQRTSRDEAWPATWTALKAVGLGILIELTFGAFAAGVWIVGLVAT